MVPAIHRRMWFGFAGQASCLSPRGGIQRVLWNNLMRRDKFSVVFLSISTTQLVRVMRIVRHAFLSLPALIFGLCVALLLAYRGASPMRNWPAG